jgi:hypothetical protein
MHARSEQVARLAPAPTAFKGELKRYPLALVAARVVGGALLVGRGSR